MLLVDFEHLSLSERAALLLAEASFVITEPMTGFSYYSLRDFHVVVQYGADPGGILSITPFRGGAFQERIVALLTAGRWS